MQTEKKLNDEQEVAVGAMVEFLKDPSSRFFLLEGYAGTGKTFSVRELLERTKGRVIFTAPTNKATRVLRDTLTSTEYKPECRTIYSLLGLRLEPNGEVKELTIPEDPVDLTQYRAVIVDEGSMVNKTLMHHIHKAAQEQKIKFIFMGDAAQLPPVKEASSPIWGLRSGPSAKLERVMRHDNQILTLATAIRKIVDHPAPKILLASDNDAGQGVWKCSGEEFDRRLMEAAGMGRFSTPGDAKAIAWRNVIVDAMNKRIRYRIFAEAAANPWLVGDRVILTEPAKNLDDEIIASTDDEGTVTRVAEDWHPVWGEFKIWVLNVTTDDNRTITLRVLHEDAKAEFSRRSEELAAQARANRRQWHLFWGFKESFHSVRHAYAITAHRSQGSTYTAAFVSWRDILLNQNRQEAFRCLYVACTRPKKELYLD